MAKAKNTTGSTAKRTTKASSRSKASGNGTATAVAPALAPVAGLEDSIRVRAYQLYEEGGYVYGRAMDDWLRAEAEVLSLNGAAKA